MPSYANPGAAKTMRRVETVGSLMSAQHDKYLPPVRQRQENQMPSFKDRTSPSGGAGMRSSRGGSMSDLMENKPF
jgi:hypothetical protein